MRSKGFFTLSLLGVMTVTAWLTKTHSSRISRLHLRRFGFAPRHLDGMRADLDGFRNSLLGRIFGSIFVTHGGRAFWSSLALTGLGAGSVEAKDGSRRAGSVFLGVHLLTSLLGAAVAWMLHRLGVPSGTEVYDAEDVGPSAGYFGCMGYAIARPFGRGRRRAGLAAAAIIQAALTFLLWKSYRRSLIRRDREAPESGAADPGVGSENIGAELGGHLAHFLAFPIGFLFGLR